MLTGSVEGERPCSDTIFQPPLALLNNSCVGTNCFSSVFGSDEWFEAYAGTGDEAGMLLRTLVASTRFAAETEFAAAL
jgi:hypothetical protein